MHLNVDTMLRRMTVQFNTGNFLALTENFVFPLPVQMDKNLGILHTPADMVIALADYRAQNVLQGLAPSYPQTVAIDIPRNGRFRVWVDWVYQPNAGPEHPRTKNLYFCSTVGSRVQIEMIQYLLVAAKPLAMQTLFTQRCSA
jgi:hypothetical protein